MGTIRKDVVLKQLSRGVRLPKGYRKKLLEGFVEDKRRRQRDREKESKLRAARLAGKAPYRDQVFKRSEWVRAMVVREVSTELRSLVMHRGCGIQEFCSNILEEVVWLWKDHPTDPVLYLKRCEDPAEAEAVIQPDFNPNQPRPFISEDKVHHLRVNTFFDSVWELLGMGYSVEEVQGEVRVLWDCFKRRNPLTHPMRSDTDASDHAAYQRRWKASKKAAVDQAMEEKARRGAADNEVGAEGAAEGSPDVRLEADGAEGQRGAP